MTTKLCATKLCKLTTMTTITPLKPLTKTKTKTTFPKWRFGLRDKNHNHKNHNHKNHNHKNHNHKTAAPSALT